jgi:hypothetical protein
MALAAIGSARERPCPEYWAACGQPGPIRLSHVPITCRRSRLRYFAGSMTYINSVWLTGRAGSGNIDPTTPAGAQLEED